MDYEKLLRLAYDYNHRLDDFISKQKLPYTWFDKGQDHVAVKAYHPEDYQGIVRRFKPVSERIAEAKLQNRWIATATLMGNFALKLSLSVSDWMPVKEVEIMLARPEEQSNEPPRFDHSEIYVPDKMIPINRVLKSRDLHPFWQRNEAHEWISVTFGEQREEVKFTEKRLSEITDEEIEIGKARVIYRRENEGLQQTGSG